MNGILNKTTLIAALAIQVAIVAVLLAVRSGGQASPAPFLEFDRAAVDGLAVANDEGEVSLVKQDDAWQLPDGLPADGAKVDGVLEKLADAGGWPVATSTSVQERFEVADDNHQRHLTLSVDGETVADIYLGTSPGYRKAHARRADDDDIYAITFSNFEAGVKASDWLDKSLLKPDGVLTGLHYDGAFALTKNDDGAWTAESGASLDQTKVETLAGRFTGLTVTGVSETTVEAVLADVPPEGDAVEPGADEEAAPADDATEEETDAAEPKTPVKMTFALRDDAGTQTLTIRRMGETEYVATSDRLPGVYRLSSYIAEQMHKTLADLAPDEPEPAESEPAADAPEDPAAAEDAQP